MKYFKVYLLFFATVFIACETDVDVSNLLNKRSLTVINGYISPQDETLTVQVSQSVSRFENANPSEESLAISSAEVVISDADNNQIKLLYNQETFQYEIASELFPIQSGATYFLSVIIEDKEYTAVATIPSGQVTEIDKEFSTDDGIDMIKIKFKDVPEQDNFYIVGVDVSDSEEPVGSTFFDDQKFVTDANRDGATLTTTGEIFFFQNDMNTQIPYTIQVANVERILYDNFRAIFLSSDGEDILIEPVVFPNNIKGDNGFGVFAGYNLAEKEEVFIP